MPSDGFTLAARVSSGDWNQTFEAACKICETDSRPKTTGINLVVGSRGFLVQEKVDKMLRDVGWQLHGVEVVVIKVHGDRVLLMPNRAIVQGDETIQMGFVALRDKHLERVQLPNKECLDNMQEMTMLVWLSKQKEFTHENFQAANAYAKEMRRGWEKMKSVPDAVKECSFCAAPQPSADIALKRCPCRAAWYCNRSCQVSHWKEGGHKKAHAAAAQVAASGTASEDALGCPVCMDPLADSTQIVTTPCGHQYCVHCYPMLRKLFSVCSMCRAPLP
jgi:hypothetical protein